MRVLDLFGRSDDAPVTLYECRRCGTALPADADRCRECGSEEIAIYTF